jgi:hypothetical protein
MSKEESFQDLIFSDRIISHKVYAGTENKLIKPLKLHEKPSDFHNR